MKLEEFFLNQIYIVGAVGIGIAFLQVTEHITKSKFNKDLRVITLVLLGSLTFAFLLFQLLGMIFTCCLYRNLEEDPY